MMRTGIIVVLGALLIVVALRFAGEYAPLDIGSNAPEFTAQGSGGKEYSLANLTKEGPVVLYFIGKGCPVNAMAVEYYKDISVAYEGKANFIGVINADQEKFNKWNAEFDVPFPVLLDPRNEIIDSYEAKASPWVIIVSKDQTIEKIFKGYSHGSLQELSNMMAGYAGIDEYQLEKKGLPISMSYG